ncbi:MAG TPA: anti-sigma factor [Bacillales bacterium]
MECRYGWKEEEVVDCVLARLPAEKEKAFQRHLAGCMECRESFREWESVLGEGSKEEATGPSPKVKSRVMKEITRKAQPWFRTKVIRKPTVVFVAAACTLIAFVFGTGLYSEPPQTGNILPVKGRTIVPSQTGNDSVHYGQLNTRNVNGYVWVNGSTHELMLFLNGVPRIDGKDYQAWLVAPDTKADAGILRVDEGMARLYYHGPEMENVRHIVVSVEPRGGSESQTGPRKFLIPLNR